MKLQQTFLICIVIIYLEGCDNLSPIDQLPDEDSILIETPEWKFPYSMELDDPYVYAALVDQGLWRKNFRIDNSDWEYIGFFDTTFSDGIDGARDVDAYRNDILVASRLERIWRSLDDGETWFKPKPGFINRDEEELRIFNVERSPNNPDVIYSVENDRRLFSSVDNGYTWKLVAYEDFVGPKDMSNIRLNPHKPGEVWSFGWGGGPEWWSSFIGWSNYGSEIKVNVDLGTLLGDASKDWVYDMSFDSENSEIIYIYTTKGFYKSSDGGLSWLQIGNNIQYPSFYSFIADPRHSNSLFLSKHDSVFYSNDGLESMQFVGKFREDGDKNFGVYLDINDEFLIIGTNEGIYTFPIEGIE